MLDLEFHEAADLFPMMDGEAFAELKNDIRERGQLEPIKVWRGKGLDGRNRYKACRELGIIPITQEVTGDIDPIAYVISANLHRRHLSASQRSMIAGRATEMYAAEAKKRQREGAKKAGRGRPVESEEPESQVEANLPQPVRAPQARDDAARMMNVSPRSVEHAKNVIDNAVPEINDMVLKDEVSVSAASTVASLPKPRQKEVASQGPDAVREKAKEIREGIPPMPPVDKEAEKRATLGEKWHRSMHDLWALLNSIRDIGGIEEVSRKWDRKAKDKVATDLRRIVAELEGWLQVLDKE